MGVTGLTVNVPKEEAMPTRDGRQETFTGRTGCIMSEPAGFRSGAAADVQQGERNVLLKKLEEKVSQEIEKSF